MLIKFKVTDNDILDDLLIIIKKHLHLYINSNIDRTRAKYVTKFLKSLHINIRFDVLLDICIDKLKISKSGSYAICYIDTYAYINKTTKLTTLIATINYGNLTFRGYNILNEAFKYINNNINGIIEKELNI